MHPGRRDWRWRCAVQGAALVLGAVDGIHAAEIPFQSPRGLIVAEGSIAGRAGLRLLIDTGAARSMVDVRTARALGLESLEAPIVLADVARARATHQVRVIDLSLGPILIRSLPVVADDLSALGSGTRLDAVIGLDVLRSSSFAVDYVARRIEFGPRPASAATVALSSVTPFLTTTVEIEGRPMRLLVDTAAQTHVLFEGRAVLPRLPWRVRAVETVSGRAQLRQMESLRIRLDGAEWNGQPVTLVPPPRYASLELDGILAIPALGPKRLEVDFERGSLGFTVRR